MNDKENRKSVVLAVSWPWRAGLSARPITEPPLSVGGLAHFPGRTAAMLRAEAVGWLRACGAFEWVALSYLGLTSLLIVIFHRNLPHAPLYLLLQIGVAVLIVALCARVHRSSPGFLTWLRCWYPSLFFLFCFEELHYLVHLIFPGWFDRWLIAFDHGLLGVHATVWLEQFGRPGLNDFMQMAYMTYFFYLVVLGALLYARGEREAYWAVMTSAVVSYTIGYAVAILVPIEGPYHALAALQRTNLTGGFFTSLINLVERFGRVHGAAFPSAHVSGSTVALLGAWRYRRWLFWVFLPFFLCMLVSTVYGRYHYVADVFGGLATGGVGFWLGHRLIRVSGALPPLRN